MHMPGRRTVCNLIMKTQVFLFDALRMERVTEERHRLALVKAMGFDGQWDDHREFQMDFLRRNGLNQKTRFLEIGSGPLTLGVPLMQELGCGNYTGVDVRERVASLGYMEIARSGLSARNPRLIVSDKFGADFLGNETFDIVWSFSVLYHLNDDLIEEWFANVKKRLAPDGRYWANYNDRMEESRWLEFPFLNRSAEFYENVTARNGLTLNVLGTIEELGFKGLGPEKNNTMVEIRHANRAIEHD